MLDRNIFGTYIYCIFLYKSGPFYAFYSLYILIGCVGNGHGYWHGYGLGYAMCYKAEGRLNEKMTWIVT